MKFFAVTTTSTGYKGRVKSSEVHIVESDIHDAVKGAEAVAEKEALDYKMEGFEVFWDFEETGFKAVGKLVGNIGASIMYITVKAL